MVCTAHSSVTLYKSSICKCKNILSEKKLLKLFTKKEAYKFFSLTPRY